MKELILIQSELKAPKSQYNEFGKYYYRNCEDILEALKPLLLKYECTLTIMDHVTEVGGRIYVKAIASLNKGDQTICVTAYAREAQDQKGMSDAQITGSASSYARKYALNGLFLIDDTKDDDTRETPKKANSVPTKGTPTQKQIDMLKKNGKWVEGMTFEEASKEIGKIINK